MPGYDRCASDGSLRDLRDRFVPPAERQVDRYAPSQPGQPAHSANVRIKGQQKNAQMSIKSKNVRESGAGRRLAPLSRHVTLLCKPAYGEADERTRMTLRTPFVC